LTKLRNIQIKLVLKWFIINNEQVKKVAALLPRKFKIFVISSLNISTYKSLKYGDQNPDLTFLVIGGHTAGLYSIIHNVVGYLIYSDQRGFIPVIDYTNHPTFYHYNGEKVNVYEHFFNQPTLYSLKEVYQSKIVIHTPTTFSNDYSSIHEHIINKDVEKILQINRIFKKYIQYNDLTSMFIENRISLLQSQNLIGVYVRGTDYSYAPGHHRQPVISKIFDAIDELLEKYVIIDGIYLATEDQTILDSFISRYSDRLFFQKKNRIDCFTPGQRIKPTSSAADSKDEIIMQGREYLADIEILSRLKFFISGINNGSAAVIEKNGNEFIDSRVFFEGMQ